MESDDYVPQFSQLLDSSGGQAIDVGNLVVDYAGGGQSQNAGGAGGGQAVDVDSSLVDPFIPPTPIPPYAGPDASMMNRVNVSYSGSGQIYNQQRAQTSLYDQFSSPLVNQQNSTAYYAAAAAAAQNQFTARDVAPAAVRGKKKQTKAQQQGGGPRTATPRIRNPAAVRQPQQQQQQSTSRYADNFQINRPVYAAPQPPVGVYGAQVPMRPYNTSMGYDYGSQQQGNVGNSAQIYGSRPQNLQYDHQPQQSNQESLPPNFQQQINYGARSNANYTTQIRAPQIKDQTEMQQQMTSDFNNYSNPRTSQANFSTGQNFDLRQNQPYLTQQNSNRETYYQQPQGEQYSPMNQYSYQQHYQYNQQNNASYYQQRPQQQFYGQNAAFGQNFGAEQQQQQNFVQFGAQNSSWQIANDKTPKPPTAAAAYVPATSWAPQNPQQQIYGQPPSAVFSDQQQQQAKIGVESKKTPPQISPHFSMTQRPTATAASVEQQQQQFLSQHQQTSSVAVVMPPDHRGPAVQLNIQPNSQPTTLITLFQLPPGATNAAGPPPPNNQNVVGAAAAANFDVNCSQANAIIPQEPVPRTPVNQYRMPPMPTAGVVLPPKLYNTTLSVDTYQMPPVGDLTVVDPSRPGGSICAISPISSIVQSVASSLQRTPGSSTPASTVKKARGPSKKRVQSAMGQCGDLTPCQSSDLGVTPVQPAPKRVKKSPSTASVPRKKCDFDKNSESIFESVIHGHQMSTTMSAGANLLESNQMISSSSFSIIQSIDQSSSISSMPQIFVPQPALQHLTLVSPPAICEPLTVASTLYPSFTVCSTSSSATTVPAIELNVAALVVENNENLLISPAKKSLISPPPALKLESSSPTLSRDDTSFLNASSIAATENTSGDLQLDVVSLDTPQLATTSLEPLVLCSDEKIVTTATTTIMVDTVDSTTTVALATTLTATAAADSSETEDKQSKRVRRKPSTPKELKTKKISKYAKKPTVRRKRRKLLDYEVSDDEAEKARSGTQKTRQHLSASITCADSASQSNLATEEAGTSFSEQEANIQIQQFQNSEARRSSRVTTRKKYNEDWDIEDDKDQTQDDNDVPRSRTKELKDPAAELFFVDNPNEEEGGVVDKILSTRTSKKVVQVEKIVDKETEGEKIQTEGVIKEEQEVEVEEFCVKYKNFSYLHCEWKTVEELEKGDKKIAGKIKRFKMKQQNVLFVEEFDEEQPFHPDMITVERILDVSRPLNFDQKSKNESTKELLNVSNKSDENRELDVENDDQQHDETTTEVKEQEKTGDSNNKSPVLEVHYLVKWRGLAYEECTWELESDVDPDKIKAFEARRYPPSSENKYKTRPDDWRKVPEDTKYKNGNELREYQMEGINWLLFCWCNRQNCILADEMGLGKTVQSVTFLVEIQKISALRGPFLIIAPLSTIINWQREFETWSDFNTVVYHGSSASRRMIQEYEMFYKDDHGERLSTIFKFDAIITTYEMIMLEREMLKDIPWRVLIIDEAHRLKNRNCKLMTGLSQFKVEHRVLLTGTPLQNNIEELFSLLNFLEPKQFCNSQMFLEEFGTLQSDDQVQQIQEILKPMMLRRLKEDVEKSLKPKEETIIEVELTNIQKKYYRAILERNFAYLSRGSSVPSLMNTMMELRKCCNHPFLINGAEDQIIQELKSSRKEDEENVEEDQLYYHGMVQSSGKLVLIDKLLPRLRSSGHKVLVFSQMVRCLDILEDYLIAKKYPFERIDGNVRGDLRQAAIDRFSKPECDRFVFLLCTRAGGLGINLTAADTVIIFDSDWNPQNDLQAQARCHRIGQEKFVKVYRLICRNSYEREMFDKASLKLGLDKAVLQSMGSSKEKPTAQLSKKEIEELLRKGAYGALMDENNEGDAFCEEDIDQILQRRTTTVTVQAGVKGSTFAKASFAVSGNRSDIDVNDPNFWQKWARKANIDVDVNSNSDLILYEPRQRKRRFNGVDDDSRSNRNAADDEDDNDSTTAGGGENGGGANRDNNNSYSDSADSDSYGGGSLGARRRRRMAGGKIDPRSRYGRKNTRASRNSMDEDFHQGGANNFKTPDGDELAFLKSDYLRVEKFLSQFGWGRWRDILHMCNFKRPVSEMDVEFMCRTVLLHCLRQYTGDPKVKSFVWDLITPPQTSSSTFEQSSTPAAESSDNEDLNVVKNSPKNQINVKKIAGQKGPELMGLYHQGWAAAPAYNPPVLAVDYSYERHLQRHANKVLLRVKLLRYLQSDIIGGHAVDIFNGAKANLVPLAIPWLPETPCSWWNREADKSLLIGIFKHGLENFDEIRRDPDLFFASIFEPFEAKTSKGVLDNKLGNKKADLVKQELEDIQEEEDMENYHNATIAETTASKENEDDETLLEKKISKKNRKDSSKTEKGEDEDDKNDKNQKGEDEDDKSDKNQKGEDEEDKSDENQKGENDDADLGCNSENSNKNQKDEGEDDNGSKQVKKLREVEKDYTSLPKAGNICKKSERNNEDDSVENSEKQSLDDDSPLLALVAKSQEKFAKIVEKEPIEERPPTPVKEPLPFPSSAELSARFRKLIALHQRTYPKDLKFETESSQFLSRFAKKNLLQQSLLQEREMKRLEERQRWSKREEAEFYRALIAFGIEKNLDTGEIVWSRFKDLAKLRHKLDHTLTEYYHSFEAMCKRVCRRSLTQEEECLSYLPESLSEDRATKVCQRVDFMARLRSLLKPSNQQQLDERIRLTKKTPDLPDWWIIGKHDLDLLKGAAKHGLAKMEENLVLDPEFSFKEIFFELQKEVNSNRAVTRNLSKLTSGSSSEKLDAASTSTEKRYSTTDQIISDILSDQHAISSEILVHWPKERAVVMRLQNLCYLIENGEWPTGNKAANLSTIPDWQSLAEPINLELDSKYDLSDTQARLEEYKRNFGGSKLKSLSSSTSSANTKQAQALNLVDLYQATLANKMLKMKHYQTGNANLFDETTDSTDSARKHPGTSRRGRKPGSGNPNPLQDLMNGEKERMRSLMHQTFLQQLELGGAGSNSNAAAAAATAAALTGNPFGFLPAALSSPQSAAAAIAALTAAGFNMASSPTTTTASSLTPTTIGSTSTSRTRPMTVRESLAMLGKGSPTTTATRSGGHQKSTSRTSGGASGDQALNLSTKKGSFGMFQDSKQDSAERSASRASSLLANFDSGLGSISNIFGNLSADSRIPLINLRDGSRLTGKEAPMLKDLASFLYKNQHYMIDMMAQSGLGNMDHDLEPGEIVRNASSKTGGESRSTPKSSTTTAKTTSRTSFSGGGGSSSSSLGDPYTHVSVVNRKNGLKLSGQKAPQLKNLAVWLEKNPDWDVDLCDLAQPQSSKSSTSHDKEAKTSSSKSHTSKDAKSSSSSKSVPLGMSPFDFLLASGGSLPGFDPWTSLLTGGLPSTFSNQGGGGKSLTSNSAENAAAAAAAALFPFLNPFLTSGASGTSPSFGLSLSGANFGGCGTSTSSAHNSPSLRQHSPSKASKISSQTQSSTPCEKSSNQDRTPSTSSGNVQSSSSKKTSSSTAAASSNNNKNEFGNLSAAALEQLTAAAALASLNPLHQLTGGGVNAGGGQSSSTRGSPAASSSLNSGIFASSSNPFLSSLSASPFMTSSGGLPFGPSNFTAIAQLQALMGLQSLDASTFNPSLGLNSTISNIVTTTSSVAKESQQQNTKTTSSSCQPKMSTTTKSSTAKSGVSTSTSEQSSSSRTTVSTTPTAGGGGKKLNALADKLASSKSKSSGSKND